MTGPDEPAGPPAGEDMIADMRELLRKLTRARVTIVCPPDVEAVVLDAARRYGLAHLVTVRTSPLPVREIFMFPDELLDPRAELGGDDVDG